MTTSTPTFLLTSGMDTGVSGSDGITALKTILLTGTATPGNRVQVFDDINRNGLADYPDQTLGGVIVGADGTWSLKLQLAEGSYSLTAIADDGVLQSGLSTAIPLTIDDTAPTLSSITLLDPTTTNASVLRYEVTFSEAVTAPRTTDFGLLASGIEGASVLSVTPVSGSEGRSFTVAVSSGSGEGTLALRVLGSSVTDIAGSEFASVFREAHTYATGLNPASVAVADIDHDGQLDLVVSNLYSSPLNADGTFGPGNVSVFLGNGDGSFQDARQYTAGSGPYVAGLADVNGDGNLDLIELNAFQGLVNYEGRTSANVSVLFGDGHGAFTPGATYDVGIAPESMVLADVNRDGHADILVANAVDSTISVLLGKADGTFQPQLSYRTGAGPGFVAAGDLDGDGKLDIVVTNGFDDSLTILKGNGDGTFRAQRPVHVGNSPNSVAIGDLDGDGRQDLVVANYLSSDVQVLRGKGDGTFKAAESYTVGQGRYVVGIADVDGDGSPDLVVSNAESATLSVLLGKGDGTFQAATTVPTGNFPALLALADVNGDGRVDAVVPNYDSGTLSIMLNATLTNISAAYHVDTLALAPAGLGLAPGSDSGVSASDLITSHLFPTITGIGEAGAVLTLMNGGTMIGSGTVGVDGSWSITPTAALAEGENSLVAFQVDLLGNASAGSAPLLVTLDTLAPAAPGKLATAAESRFSHHNISDDTTPTITGTAEAGSLVTLYGSHGEALGSALAAADGGWQVTSMALADGLHSVTARSMDAAGNVSMVSGPLTLVIDAAEKAGFNAAYYLNQNPDVAASGMDPYLHYKLFGWQEGRDPSLGFDTHAYLEANPDVAGAAIDPLAHYLDFGQAEGRARFIASPHGVGAQDPLVDNGYYFAHNLDVAAAGVDPLTHYGMFGWQEGRDPNALFDTGYYLEHNPDVAAAGINPLLHYELFGWKEGRDPSAEFSTAKYLEANPDVDAAGLNPLVHYQEYGSVEGRQIFGV